MEARTIVQSAHLIKCKCSISIKTGRVYGVDEREMHQGVGIGAAGGWV